MTLFGFLGLKPVFVAKENLVTQLSYFFCAGCVPDGAGSGLDVVTSLVIDALIALLSLLSALYLALFVGPL